MDPRTRLGVQLETAGAPYKTVTVNRTDPGEGGSLDRGLVATLPDGREVVFGEIWAAGIYRQGGRKVSLDIEGLASRLLAALNGEPGGPRAPFAGDELAGAAEAMTWAEERLDEIDEWDLDSEGIAARDEFRDLAERVRHAAAHAQQQAMDAKEPMTSKAERRQA